MHKIIFTLKTSDNIFLVSGFFYDKNLHIFFSKNNKSPFTVSLSFYWFFFLYCFQDLSPAAPSAALAAPGRPYLSTVGAPVADVITDNWQAFLHVFKPSSFHFVFRFPARFSYNFHLQNPSSIYRRLFPMKKCAPYIEWTKNELISTFNGFFEEDWDLFWTKKKDRRMFY